MEKKKIFIVAQALRKENDLAQKSLSCNRRETMWNPMIIYTLLNKIKFTCARCLILCTVILFTCCTDSYNTIYESDPSDQPSTAPVVTVLYDANGLGDRSYNDLIYQGTEKAAGELQLRTRHISPESREKGLICLEEVMRQMAQASDTIRRLLIVAGSGYEDYVRQHNSMLDSNKYADLLFLETDTPLEGKGSTLCLPYYGATYEAGALTPHFAQNVLLVAANSALPVLQDACKGYTDGFNSGLFPADRALSLTTQYLSDQPDGGFSVADSTALQLLTTFHDDTYHRMVVPLCGGAASVFQHIADILNNFLFMGVDRTVTSASCPLSVVKHIDRAVKEEIGLWLSAQGMPKHQSLGLAEGYTGVEIHVIANDVDVEPVGELSDELRRQIHDEAVRKEAEREK